MKHNNFKTMKKYLLIFALLLWAVSSWAQTTTYYTAGSFTVPQGVTSVYISSVGGSAGYGGQDCGNGCSNPGPGEQGFVNATYSVSPGMVISYYPGGNGGNGGNNVNNGGYGAAGSSTYSSSYNGGTGGKTGSVGSSGGGGGGGAATIVVVNGSLAIIAGGAGGGGGNGNIGGSGRAGQNSFSNDGYSYGGYGGDCGGNDGGGGGGGGGGYQGSNGGGVYWAGSEYAGNGGYAGSNWSSIGSSSGLTYASQGYVTIIYTAVGGTASAVNPTLCSGGSTTINLTGSAGTVQWYKSTDGSNYSAIGGATSTSYATGVLSTTTYYKAQLGGVSIYSTVATVSISANTTTPSSASCTGTTNTTANLSWGTSTGQGTITYYWVVGTSPSITYPNGSVPGMYGSTTGTTATATNLSPSTGYYLVVYANGLCGNSLNQTSAMFTTLPTAPVANAATLVRANSFTANWSASTGATAYYLDVSLSNTFASFLSGYNNKPVGNVLSIGLTGLSNNTTYYYRVRAYNAGGYSTNSNMITTLTLPVSNFLIEKVGGGNIADQTAGGTLQHSDYCKGCL